MEVDVTCMSHTKSHTKVGFSLTLLGRGMHCKGNLTWLHSWAGLKNVSVQASYLCKLAKFRNGGFKLTQWLPWIYPWIAAIHLQRPYLVKDGFVAAPTVLQVRLVWISLEEHRCQPWNMFQEEIVGGLLKICLYMHEESALSLSL